jgi:hypothetical protein
MPAGDEVAGRQWYLGRTSQRSAARGDGPEWVAHSRGVEVQDSGDCPDKEGITSALD